jgi:hypothetical protein
MVMKFIYPILALLMFTVTVSALSVPQPLTVFIVNDGDLSGYDVTETNVRTGEVLSGTSDASGFVYIEWSTAKLGWASGDQITLQIVGCSESACTQKFSLNGNPISYVADLTGVSCPKCGTCGTHTCPDCNCGSCPTDTTPYTSCDSCCAELSCPVDNTPYDW